MKFFIYSIFLVLIVSLGISIGGDIVAFIDMPSLLFSVFLILGCMLAKYGKKIFLIGSLNSIERNELARDGIVISILSGSIGTVIGLVIMLGNLSDQAAIGPATAVALLTLFYGLIIATLFVPLLDTKGASNGIN